MVTEDIHVNQKNHRNECVVADYLTGKSHSQWLEDLWAERRASSDGVHMQSQ